jgi:hypothetical protein
VKRQRHEIGAQGANGVIDLDADWCHPEMISK